MVEQDSNNSPAPISMWLYVCLAVALIITLVAYVFSKKMEAPTMSTEESSAKRRVLLTGFEPFGGGSVNSSWEAVKDFDKTTIDGAEIHVRQLSVVWGKPIEELNRAIDETKPDVVISFGQGYGADFKIETVARNNRVMRMDNKNSPAPNASILAGAPDFYRSTIDFAGIRAKLTVMGFPVELSTDAGAYLCEECLFSLEHIKATRTPNLQVMFIHMPKIGGDIGKDSNLTVGYLSSFVHAVVQCVR